MAFRLQYADAARRDVNGYAILTRESMRTGELVYASAVIWLTPDSPNWQRAGGACRRRATSRRCAATTARR